VYNGEGETGFKNLESEDLCLVRYSNFPEGLMDT